MINIKQLIRENAEEIFKQKMFDFISSNKGISISDIANMFGIDYSEARTYYLNYILMDPNLKKRFQDELQRLFSEKMHQFDSDIEEVEGHTADLYLAIFGTPLKIRWKQEWDQLKIIWKKILTKAKTTELDVIKKIYAEWLEALTQDYDE